MVHSVVFFTVGNGINREAFIYYYHPDHLGSSSYITDINGEVTQHVEYFAFGETFLEEHSNTDRTPYLFNGKELDEETGLYYYGARYYDAKTSVWQSVDSEWEKVGSHRSPYEYVMSNPMLAQASRLCRAIVKKAKTMVYSVVFFTVGNGINREAFIYYYHPDHLGSSSYITDINGEVTQHVEYFAFGETFLEEHSNTDRTPYLFNAKELDEETGLYYYGARYYDAKTSVWQSVDPLVLYNPVMEVESYIDGQHNGGVFNSGNLASYSYTYGNPIIFIDPNGKQVVVTEANGTFTIQMRANFQNNSSDTNFDMTKFIEKATKSTNKLYKGADITITIVNDPNATISVDIVTQVGNPTVVKVDDDNYQVRNVANGSTARTGDLASNTMTLSRNIPNLEVEESGAKLKSSKRGYNSIGKTFRHELGHILGLYHPFSAGNTLEDIDQDNAKTNEGDIPNSTIKKNFMNSQENPKKSLRNTGGGKITPQQIEHVKNLSNSGNN